MKNAIKKLLHSVFFLFVNKKSYRNLRDTPVFKSMIYNFRFKLAGCGIYLTQNEKWMASLKDKYKGKRCFIIGNGPSLNKIDLTLLKDEYTFGMNAIYLNYEKMQFHPTFYVVEDFLVAEDRANEINNYKGPEAKFIGTFLEYVLKKDEKTIITNVNVYVDEKDPFPYFSDNCAKNIGFGGTVSYQCMQLAFYMGFDKVYLVGFDHNYKIPKNTDLSKTTVIESKDDDENHFSKEYFGKGYRWNDPKMDRMETTYKYARKYFEDHGRKIVNATKGGSLEIYERVNYENLF